MVQKHLLLRLMIGLALCAALVGATCIVVLAAGSWHGTQPDSPDWGYQNWYNLDTQVQWEPTFMWTAHNPPTSDRRIELEWFDPGTNPKNFCNRLRPIYLEERGGDWIDSWWTSNECGGLGSQPEQITITLKENNINPNTYYQAAAWATKEYTATYGGECNVSWTGWGGEEWLGKQLYTASYSDDGSDP